MIYLLSEPEYSDNRQAQEIIKGLNRYAGKRKHSLIYCSDVEEVDHACKTIIVLCASDIWVKQTLQRLCAVIQGKGRAVSLRNDYGEPAAAVPAF